MKYFSRLLLVFLAFILSACFESKQTKYADIIRKNKIHARHTMPIIVLDAGHGSLDPGAHNELCEEKTLTLKTALYTKAELIKMGYRVVMTRSRDEFITLKKRAQIANDLKSQVLVSIHFNSAQNKKAHGIEVFYPKKAKPWKQKRSKLLAQTILRKMLVNTGAQSRGIKEGNFCVIRETNMPAVLVECGFITNDRECRKMLKPDYQKLLGKSIAQGLNQYFDL
ncbi:MAG: Sporulation-specific N-acetylmuramoyl-L-alanine amidase [Chlamydiia bacterium]|nr:Sporulation-specific N-acetylmuramoyl-L-alanine amidase [Chlamydiia bacterium]MCH9618672.1 Sporulation-specific N-acetylmuramoyl-L-alanine amidase [Chlamydiia bacterium]